MIVMIVTEWERQGQTTSNVVIGVTYPPFGGTVTIVTFVITGQAGPGIESRRCRDISPATSKSSIILDCFDFLTVIRGQYKSCKYLLITYLRFQGRRKDEFHLWATRERAKVNLF